MYLLDSANFEISRKSAEQENVADKDRRAPVCCSVCKNRITSESELIEIDGSIEHSKVNPAGARYEIRCYKSASGCRAFGQPTSEHSWFVGSAWQFAHCNQCGVQLGWYFTGMNSFYGLVIEQIIDCDE